MERSEREASGQNEVLSPLTPLQQSHFEEATCLEAPAVEGCGIQANLITCFSGFADCLEEQEWVRIKSGLHKLTASPKTGFQEEWLSIGWFSTFLARALRIFS